MLPHPQIQTGRNHVANVFFNSIRAVTMATEMSVTNSSPMYVYTMPTCQLGATWSVCLQQLLIPADISMYMFTKRQHANLERMFAIRHQHVNNFA